jgi:hypothetical protein
MQTIRIDWSPPDVGHADQAIGSPARPASANPLYPAAYQSSSATSGQSTDFPIVERRAARTSPKPRSTLGSGLSKISNVPPGATYGSQCNGCWRGNGSLVGIPAKRFPCLVMFNASAALSAGEFARMARVRPGEHLPRYAGDSDKLRCGEPNGRRAYG